jgi:hypothetical protein
MRAGSCNAHIVSAAWAFDVDLSPADPSDLYRMRVADEHDDLAEVHAGVRALQIDIGRRCRQIAAVAYRRARCPHMIRRCCFIHDLFGTDRARSQDRKQRRAQRNNQGVTDAEPQRHLLAGADAERLHLAIQMGAVEPQRLSSAAHVAVALIHLLQDEVALVGVAGFLQ